MTGVLFVVNVPRKEYEQECIKKEQSSKLVVEKEKYENASKILDELKSNQKFGNLKTSLEPYVQDDDNIGISKCNSTDCLHRNYVKELYKSKSENQLDLGEESKSYLKTSWEDIKQVIKARRKINVTRQGSKVDIVAAFHWDTPLETVLSEVIFRLDIKNAAWCSTKDDNFWQVTFSLESSSLCEELLQVLRTFGIGSRHQSSVSVIPCTLYYTANAKESSAPIETDHFIHGHENSMWSRLSSSVRSRTNLAQVLHVVRAEAALTFDWLFLLIVAAFVAAIGLVENSTIILVASMLISPLMGPITASTLGTAVHDRSLQQMGVRHELLGLFLALVIGFIFGLAICAVDERYGVGEWPTPEMMSRCEIRSLWVGLLVAIPSGAGVALAVLGEYTASLVGVAISASLLPPAVNAGLLWAMSLVHLIFIDDNTRWTNVVKTSYYSTSQPTELAVLGTVSLCLTLVNIVCIFLTGVTVYKVKEVCPVEPKDISWWRTHRNLLTTKDIDKSDSSAAWGSYSKWSNESEDNKQVIENVAPITTHERIQSDTVTYRRHHLTTQRLRANNIEAYYNRNTRVKECSTPITTETTTNASPDDSLNEIPESGPISKFIYNDPKKPVTDDKVDVQHTQNFESGYTFNNIGFEGLEDVNKNLSCKTERPTIEPSLNFTVGHRKLPQGGIFLGSKSFDV